MRTVSTRRSAKQFARGHGGGILITSIPASAPVSVVVLAYNERECIADTLGSLLTGDHPIEIVVVDDGSTDGTADIAAAVRDPRVRVIRQPNAGKAAALNTGIVHARHELIVMMDGDTVFEPDTVRRLVQPFTERRVGAVAGNAKIVSRRGLIARWQHLEYVVGFAIDRRVRRPGPVHRVTRLGWRTR